MCKTIYYNAMYDFCVEYSDGAFLTFECTEEDILDLAERYSDGCAYVIYKIKEIKEIYKEKKKNEKV